MFTENGIETAKRIKLMKPDIKIILTSGDYTSGINNTRSIIFLHNHAKRSIDGK